MELIGFQLGKLNSTLFNSLLDMRKYSDREGVWLHYVNSRFELFSSPVVQFLFFKFEIKFVENEWRDCWDVLSLSKTDHYERDEKEKATYQRLLVSLIREKLLLTVDFLFLQVSPLKFWNV